MGPSKKSVSHQHERKSVYRQPGRKKMPSHAVKEEESQPEEAIATAIFKETVMDAEPAIRQVAQEEYCIPTPRETDAMQVLSEGLQLLHILKAEYPLSFFPEDFFQEAFDPE